MGGLLYVLSACNLGNTGDENHDSENPNAWSEKNSCEKKWKKFSNEFFSICFPEQWSSDDSGSFGSELVLTNKDLETLADGRSFSQNINVMRQDAQVVRAQSINNLDEFAEFSKNQIVSYLYESEIFTYEKVEIAGIEAYRNIMTANQNGAQLYFEQYMFQLEDDYFVMTFTSSAEANDNSKKMGTKIMNTLQVNLAHP